MTLPTFVGVGAQRSGTTWMTNVLATHPDIFIPRREIHYFSRYLDRGRTWYEAIFPDQDKAAGYKAIGESSPAYMAHEDVPRQMHMLIPDAKIIVNLRDPVARSYSEYTAFCKTNNGRMTFDDFLKEHPKATTRSLYSEQLKRLFAYYPRERVLILNFDRFVRDNSYLTEQLAEFLDVDADKFDLEAARSQNSSYMPRFPGLLAAVVKGQRMLERHDIHWTMRLGHALGLKRLFKPNESKAAKFPRLGEAERRELFEQFAADVEELEGLIGEDYSDWRPDQPESSYHPHSTIEKADLGLS